MTRGIVGVMCLGIALSGCAARKPIYIDTAFAKRVGDVITVMPVVDARPDKSAASIDVEDDIREPLVKSLRQKGYSVTAPDRFREGTPPAAAEIAHLEVAELAKLGPPESQTLLFFYLEDLSTSYVVIWKTSKIEASAVIVDKKDGQYLWRDKCVESVGQGGLISGLLPMQSMAVQTCIAKILGGVPDR